MAPVLVVSHTFPPSNNGQAVMLGRILQDLDPDRFRCVLSAGGIAMEGFRGDRIARPVQFAGHNWRLVSPFITAINAFLLGVWQFWGLCHLVRRHRCKAIVCCSGPLYELPAATLASLFLGVNLIPYYFDWYSRTPEGLPRGSVRWMSRYAAWVFERLAMLRARVVLVPNERLAAELKRLYGVHCEIVRNPTTRLENLSSPATRTPGAPWQGNIVYTGAIYEAHYDAFEKLIATLAKDDSFEFHLKLYTDQTNLTSRSVFNGPVEIESRVPPEELGRVLAQADILYLPLALDSPYPDIIRTSAPGKLGDYLAAGRPILVHAPADSFVAEYCFGHQCAAVVDAADPLQLVQVLRRLRDDVPWREKLCHNATRCAAADFDPIKCQAAFVHAISAALGVDSLPQHSSPSAVQRGQHS